MPEPFKMPKFKLQDPRLWYYRCLVLRIVDGDTVMLLQDKGQYAYNVLKVRLAGIDAPEKRPRVGTQAQREHEKALAETASKRLEQLIGGQEIIIRTEKTGKFGRWLATLEAPGGDLKVEIVNKPESANQILLDEDLAVVYGQKRPWRSE
jgi:endonuclease YncB( thermonuclease family)